MAHSLSLAIRQHSIGPRTRKYVKGYVKKQLMDTGLDAVKTASKK